MSEQELPVIATLDTATPAKRPFYKRTEFWLTVASLVFGGLVASGLIGAGTVPWKLFSMAVMVLASLGYTAGATIAKTPLPAGTPGYKTSEFWLALATTGLSAFQAIDVMPQSTEAGGLLAAMLTGAPGGAYAISRSKLKATAAMGILLAFALLGLSACSTWEGGTRTALQAVYAGGKTSSTVGRQLIGDECRAISKTCQAERRAEEAKGDEVARQKARACDPLVACHAKLHTFNTVIIDLLLGVGDGLALVELGKAAASKQVAAILEKVVKLLAVAQATVAESRAR
jgi:hypothetical protein